MRTPNSGRAVTPPASAQSQSQSQPRTTATTTTAKGKRPRPSDGDQPVSGSEKKRSRRAFSCLSCQKLKCRCEYSPGSLGCHRCKTLRIECSLRDAQATAGALPLSAPGSSSVQASSISVEERLQNHEETLEEIKCLLKDLKSSPRQPHHRDHHVPPPPPPPEPSRSQNRNNPSPQTSDHFTPAGVEDDGADPGYLSRPADKGTKSAPIVVLREIGQKVTQGYRRLLEHMDFDLVQLELIGEDTAHDLIQAFFRHQASHSLVACKPDDISASGNARKVSAFLHSTCCLLGVVYREDLCGSPMHRHIYEQVRLTLGQALLSSPLSLQEINAILLMSNNGNTPSQQGSEYMDSWLLTGYGAKQAMLTISFSQIVNRLKKGASTTEDQKAIHLWSLICLHHLHWAATTGRPSVIPTAYVNQCTLLLNFYHATMQDGMLVAEINLYLQLHQKLYRHSYDDDNDEDDGEEFQPWRQRWNHLLLLPTSSMLKIGYHAACLILAVRTLEETGDALRPQAFLSGAQDHDSTDHASDDGHDLNNNHNKGDDENNATSDHQDENRRRRLRSKVCRSALKIIEVFLEMPRFLMDSVPTCLCLCIGYCALMLAHYDESHSGVSDQRALELILRLNTWIKTSPGKAWSYKYGDMARQKIESRIHGGGGGVSGEVSSTGGPPGEGNIGEVGNPDHVTSENVHEQQPQQQNLPLAPSHEAAPEPAPRDEQNQEQEQEEERHHHQHIHNQNHLHQHPEALAAAAVVPPNHLYGGEEFHLDPTSGLLDLSEQAVFPSMESFFAGGFMNI